MKFERGLLILAVSLPANADTNDTGRYALPPNKVYIEPCKKEALTLHSGTIEKLRILHRHGDFSVEYRIQGDDGSEWLVLCSLTNGKVIRGAEAGR